MISSADSLAWPAPDPVPGSDGSPDGRVDGPATHRGLRLGTDARIPGSGFDTLTNERRAASAPVSLFRLPQRSPHANIDARRFETIDASDG
jgi:hypothetical protein